MTLGIVFIFISRWCLMMRKIKRWFWQDHQGRMADIHDAFSGETIDYSDLVELLVDLGKNIPQVKKEDDTESGSTTQSKQPQFKITPEIMAATELFKSVWQAQELDFVQTQDIDKNDP